MRDLTVAMVEHLRPHIFIDQVIRGSATITSSRSSTSKIATP
jgi:hypothetical protein